MTLIESLHAFLIKSQITLSIAESCTGGGLSAALANLSGASNYFLGSVVAYANSAKENILKVKAGTLLNYGAVSEETAYEMANGALSLFHSAVALSVTGIAGPLGGTPQKPVGTVCFAMVGKKEKIWTVYFTGDRQEILQKVIKEALSQLYFQFNH